MRMPGGEDAHYRLYADAIHAARAKGEDAFQNWFDRSESVDESLRQGHWDFAVHILRPEVVARLAHPGSLTALEIGYGGGRLLNASACFFGTALGIDVHEEEAAVASLLAQLGRDNVRLIRTDGSTIPVPDESIDFVYSFIVLQHLPSVQAFRRYVTETHRVLRPGGLAQLYVGKLAGRNIVRRFLELPEAPVNDVSLQLAPRYAARICRNAGFGLVGRGVSYRNVPDGYPRAAGGQVYLTLVKPPSR